MNRCRRPSLELFIVEMVSYFCATRCGLSVCWLILTVIRMIDKSWGADFSRLPFSRAIRPRLLNFGIPAFAWRRIPYLGDLGRIETSTFGNLNTCALTC
jgi:hypothetical protein